MVAPLIAMETNNVAKGHEKEDMIVIYLSVSPWITTNYSRHLCSVEPSWSIYYRVKIKAGKIMSTYPLCTYPVEFCSLPHIVVTSG
jgi:hypothetical protein